MTQELLQKIMLLSNLSHLTMNLQDSIKNDASFIGYNATQINDMEAVLYSIRNSKIMDYQKAINALSAMKIMDKKEVENIQPVTSFDIDMRDITNINVMVPVPGGVFTLYSYLSDPETKNVGIEYHTNKNCNPIDLVCAEVKQGELAVIDKKDADNKDIDLYIYSDLKTEDWTSKTTYKYDDILHAFD